MCEKISRKYFYVSVFVLAILLGLSASIATESLSPPEKVNVTEGLDMESSTQATLIIQGGSVDASVEKVIIDPKLDEIDEKYAKCRGIDIREINILELQTLYASGQLTAVDLTKCYLDRLEQMNPVLHAVIETNPNALSDAMKLDQELQSGNSRGPIHGIPVLLKDGIGTVDMMENTAGSPALIGIRPKKEANVVSALRKAGAIILGKSNLSEFYWFRGSNIPNGWSGRGGQTRNAYNLNVTPEGSSSGSAVSVSANLCAVSVGTETDGSMIGPANYAGICAMKPTWGLVSVKGVIPVSHTQDHVGPMARTTTDLSILLDAMVPIDERPPQHPQSYSQFMLNGVLTRPLRVGVLRYPFWDTNAINSTNLRNQLPQLENMLQMMKNSSNFEVIDPVEIIDRDVFTQDFQSNELVVLLHDFKYGLNEYLNNEVIYNPPISSNHSKSPVTSNNKTISSLKDIIEFNEINPTPQGYNQEYLIKSEATDGVQNETYVLARDTNRNTARKLLDSVLEKYNLDAVVTPSDSQPEGISEKSLENFTNFGFSIAAISGYPSIIIPAGIGPNHAPFGIMFIGQSYSEPMLLKIAHTLEQLSLQRVPPKFRI